MLQRPLYVRTPPLRGPVGQRPPWMLLEQIPAPEPIRARFHLIFSKVSQNQECHLNILKRPVIVPVYKTGRKSHLLRFPDFRFR